ncbi:c-type cytochrome domain-containing protein [Pleomorphovibrio marinus]|uniref:c-type cytochrome domain-containing protein n=1 Tax=Pleomorphovibrio marinus TaxID=2164132 RepID=UPI000E0AF661|nr:c-type cytochrome domain-containing protein [Pleomorphovibrio marinus]
MDQSADFIIFLGRFHPLFLHLPIGFLVLGFILEFVSRKEKYRSLRPAVGFTLFLGAVSALITAILGLMLATDGGYSEDLLAIHQWLGIGLVVFAFGAWFIYTRKEKKQDPKLEKAYVGLLSLMMVFLGGAGHYGGSLTHGTTYLTQYMPDGMRALAGLPQQQRGFKPIENIEEAVVFEDIVHPILEMRCNSCHNASKKKGELQMHTVDYLKKGGESGPVFVAGQPLDSEMIKRIHLPESDDDHMPPKGKTQLTPGQVALLEWWIAEGAPFDKKVAELKTNSEIDDILLTLADPDANKTEVELLLAEGVEEADPEKVKEIKSKGVMIKPLSNNENWLQVTLNKSLPVDELLAEIAEAFPNQVTWLDIKDSPVTDEGFASVAKMTNLTRLRAEKTSITDKAMGHIKELPYLEFLNIYGTKVGDEGVLALGDLGNLRSLYVWDSRVTKQGAKQLEEKLNKLEVNLGFEVTVVDSLTVQVVPVKGE